MHTLSSILLFLWALSLPLAAQEAPKHLLLHFDVGRTLTLDDPTGRKTRSDSLNELLAQRYTDQWDENVLTPLSYEEYVTKHLLPGKHRDKARYRQQKLLLHTFLNQLREQEHPLLKEVEEEFHSLQRLVEKQETPLFASIHTLLQSLKQDGRPYSIVLRSFHDDMDDVVEALQVYGISFARRGFFFADKRFSLVDEKETRDLENTLELYSQWQREPHLAILDVGEEGKPFIIDSHDPTMLSLFFDNGLRLEENHPPLVTLFDLSEKRFSSIAEGVENGWLVPVDTGAALENSNYYLELLNAKLLQHGEPPLPTVPSPEKPTHFYSS